MLSIGDKGEFSKTITEYDVYSFAGITGDFNSIHINDVAARESFFGKRIVHGMLVGSFISTVLGMYMPGPGAVYLEQNLKFILPVYIGDTITARVKIDKIIKEDKGIYSLKTVVVNQKNETVVDGNAVIKFID